MNYLLALFVGTVALWAAHNRFGTEGLIILGALLLVGCISLITAYDPTKQLADGTSSLLAWAGYLTAGPAALILAHGLFIEFSGGH